MRDNFKYALAVPTSIVALLFFPLIAVPCVAAVGIFWRQAPLWARVTLVAEAVFMIIYYVISQPKGFIGL
jgi:Fe2+ transport system protein B